MIDQSQYPVENRGFEIIGLSIDSRDKPVAPDEHFEGDNRTTGFFHIKRDDTQVDQKGRDQQEQQSYQRPLFLFIK